MRKRSLLLAAMALVVLSVPGGAAGAPYVPDEVLVKYKDGTTSAERAAVQRDSGTRADASIPGGSTELEIADGTSVKQTLDELRADPDVAYAVPNYVARAAADLVPNDPGFRLQ